MFLSFVGWQAFVPRADPAQRTSRASDLDGLPMAPGQALRGHAPETGVAWALVEAGTIHAEADASRSQLQKIALARFIGDP